MATETQDSAKPQPVLAPDGDPQGFSRAYQWELRTRIVCEYLAEILGPIPKDGGVLVTRRPVSTINQAAQVAPTPRIPDKPHTEK